MRIILNEMNPVRGRRPFQVATRSIYRAGKEAHPGFSPHGWRSVFSDWAARNDYPRDWVEDQLHHLVGNEVERSYRRGDWFEQRQAMMMTYAGWLLGTGDYSAASIRSRDA